MTWIKIFVGLAIFGVFGFANIFPGSLPNLPVERLDLYVPFF